MQKPALRIAFVLFALILAAACASSFAGAGPRSPAPDRDGGVAQPLIDLAKAHLGERLGVRTAEITVQSVTLLVFPRPTREPAETSDEIVRESSGFVIMLAANGSAYEYHGRVMGTLYMLWREL
jgi:hypothetical protein